MMKNLFLSIFETSISTSLIIIGLLIFTPLLNKRYASKWKYYIWIALAIRLIIPFNINFSSPQIVINIPTQITSPILTDTENTISIIPQAEQQPVKGTLLDFISIIWFIICICFIFIHIFSFLYYKIQIMKKGTYIEDDVILQQLLTLKQDLNIHTKVSIIKYTETISPMIIGFFQPLLVIPDHEYSQEELFFILKHELVHLRRHDTYFKFLFILVRALHWFNPFIYIMQKEAILDMELSCDERVIQGTPYTIRKMYTKTLLSTLDKQCKKTNILTTQFYGGNKIMKKRFKNILVNSNKKNGLFILVCIVGITLILGIMTGCSIINPTLSKIPLNNEFENNESLQKEDIEMQENEQDEDDTQKIKNIAEKFAAAYFGGDTEEIKNYLTVPYEWDIDVYSETGTISETKLKGLENIKEQEIGAVQVVSLEYRDSNYEDMLLYLTLEFIKQKDGWKIQFYGIEG